MAELRVWLGHSSSDTPLRQYPSPCAVRMNTGWWWSTSIFLRNRAMAKSTVRVITSVSR